MTESPRRIAANGSSAALVLGLLFLRRLGLLAWLFALVAPLYVLKQLIFGVSQMRDE